MRAMTGLLERVFDARFSLKACKRAHDSEPRAVKTLLELPNAADENRVFNECWPYDVMRCCRTSGCRRACHSAQGGVTACVDRAPARFGVHERPARDAARGVDGLLPVASRETAE